MGFQKEDIMKWKLGIVGSRNPGMSYEEWETLITSIIKLDEISEIISGGAKGIDSYGKMLAIKNQIAFKEYNPEYSKYGRNATLIRNRLIVENSDKIIAFPTQGSKGTYHSVSIAKELNKPVIIKNIDSLLKMKVDIETVVEKLKKNIPIIEINSKDLVNFYLSSILLSFTHTDNESYDSFLINIRDILKDKDFYRSKEVIFIIFITRDLTEK